MFPEATIPAYPRGLAFGTVVGVRRPEGRRLFQRYAEGAVTVPGPVTQQLGEMARNAGVYLVIGVIERDSVTGGTLYCTILFFGPDGRLLGKHRKIKPTAAERIIWGEGDGSTMPVIETPMGKMGALVCWENYMPLARMAMYAKGVELYWRATADYRETWQPTLRHIAIEGRCYVLGCNQYVTKSMYPRDLEEFAPAGRPSRGDFLRWQCDCLAAGRVSGWPLEQRRGDSLRGSGSRAADSGSIRS